MNLSKSPKVFRRPTITEINKKIGKPRRFSTMLLSMYVEEELCYLQTVFRVIISCWLLIEVQLVPYECLKCGRESPWRITKDRESRGESITLPGSSNRRGHDTVNRHGPVESCVIIQNIDGCCIKLTIMYNPVDAIYFDNQKTLSRATAVSRFLKTSGRLDWSGKKNLHMGVEGFLCYYNKKWFFCCSEGKFTQAIDRYPSKLKIMWY